VSFEFTQRRPICSVALIEDFSSCFSKKVLSFIGLEYRNRDFVSIAYACFVILYPNPTQGEFSFKHLISLNMIIWGVQGQGFFQIFPFVLTYKPNLPPLNAGLIKKYFHLLLSSAKLRDLLPPNSIISPFRRPIRTSK